MAAILNGGCCYRTNFLSEPPKYHPGLICIIGINRLKEKFHRKIQNTCLTTPCHVAAVKNLSSFWLILKQQWTTKISSPLFSIFSLVAILVKSGDHRTHFGRGPSKYHSTKVWLQLAQWFLRRRSKFTTYVKWWQKLTLPLGRWAKNGGEHTCSRRKIS